MFFLRSRPFFLRLDPFLFNYFYTWASLFDIDMEQHYASLLTERKLTETTSLSALNSINSQKSINNMIFDSQIIPNFVSGQIVFDDGQQRLRQVEKPRFFFALLDL